MSFYLKRKCVNIGKQQSFYELDKLWSWTSMEDKQKAYKLAFPNHNKKPSCYNRKF